LGIPIGDRFTVNVAVRYEEFKQIDEDTTDPKITMLWQPLDSLSLRGSWGTSFRVPSLLQSFGTLTTVGNRTDVSGETTFKPSITVGNPALTPESAENYNLGVSWAPVDGFMEGFQIDLDWFDYKYTDIITREPSQNLVNADNAALEVYRTANQGTSCASDRECWIDGMNAGVGNREQVIRNSQAILLRVLPDFANANGADVSGLDINTSYTFDTGIGNWRIGLQSAWMETYKVESAAGIISDGVGNYNSQNAVARPLPEWKVNGTLNWNFNNHRAFLIVRYVDSLTTDVLDGTTGFFAATAALAGNQGVADDLTKQLSDHVIPSMTTADIQYTYTFGELGILRNSAISLGIMNFTNEDAPAIGVVTAFDGTLHDGRGRMWFLRLNGSM
jgi:outer membrane receptor protein involved in Fe transport